jgi:hypothetical protein
VAVGAKVEKYDGIARGAWLNEDAIGARIERILEAHHALTVATLNGLSRFRWLRVRKREPRRTHTIEIVHCGGDGFDPTSVGSVRVQGRYRHRVRRGRDPETGGHTYGHDARKRRRAVVVDGIFSPWAVLEDVHVLAPGSVRI